MIFFFPHNEVFTQEREVNFVSFLRKVISISFLRERNGVFLIKEGEDMTLSFSSFVLYVSILVIRLRSIFKSNEFIPYPLYG